MPRPPTKNECRIGARLILEEHIDPNDYAVTSNAPVRLVEAGAWVTALIYVPLTETPKLTHQGSCKIDDKGWCEPCGDVHWYQEKETV